MTKIRKRGFTLLELLIVVVIVGVLASFALPAYMNTKRRVSANEAMSNLHAMIGAQKARRLLKGGFTQCDCINAGSAGSGDCNFAGAWNVMPGCNSALSMNLNPVEWAYTSFFTGGSFYGNTLAVRATKKTGSCQYQIEMSGDVIRFGAYNETITKSGADCPF